MTTRLEEPIYAFWVPGRPRSLQAKKRQDYIDSIQDAARKVVQEPLVTNRIDIEVWFAAAAFNRADVDNILKPILDALIGIVYADDAQVRSVLAAAVPMNENFGSHVSVQQRQVSGFSRAAASAAFGGGRRCIACGRLCGSNDRLIRLLEGDEFLIKIYSGATFRQTL